MIGAPDPTPDSSTTALRRLAAEWREKREEFRAVRWWDDFGARWPLEIKCAACGRDQEVGLAISHDDGCPLGGADRPLLDLLNSDWPAAAQAACDEAGQWREEAAILEQSRDDLAARLEEIGGEASANEVEEIPMERVVGVLDRTRRERDEALAEASHLRALLDRALGLCRRCRGEGWVRVPDAISEDTTHTRISSTAIRCPACGPIRAEMEGTSEEQEG